MTDPSHEFLRQLFDQAIELSGEARARFLDEQCLADPELRARLQVMLAAADDSRFLAEVEFADRQTACAGHPESIGPYRILALLGEGSMGAVYEAEGTQPRRRVALKILRIALASEEARRRFAQEGEVLGRLRHPAVAQVYEMGTASVAAGIEVPYMAMELVRGARPMTQFVRETAPAREAMLELFCHVVNGIEHAHQQGIVHRDLKPANIIVDAEGRPKVIDFGLARAVGKQGDQVSMHTRTGQVMGTPSYMSPEQFRGNSEEVGPATDIYSLGVLLFELLSGQLPHATAGLSIADVAHTVREAPPRRLTRSAGSRRLDDLDTIVGKALEKQPARRYESAAELAADLRRYLRKEPILARPASATYRALLYVRRHRLLVLSVTTVLLVSIAAAIISLQFAIAARHRADQADRAAYRAQILGAESALQGRHFAEAAELLAATPVRLRGWEYRHLASRVDRTLPSPWALQPLPATVWTTGDSVHGLVTRGRSGGGTEIALVDLQANSDRLVIDGATLVSCALSPDGRKLAVVESGPTAKLTVATIDVPTRRRLSAVMTGGDGLADLKGVAWHPAGDRYLLSWQLGFEIRAAETGARLGSRLRNASGAAWTADGRWLVGVDAGSAGDGYSADLLDAESLQQRPGVVPLGATIAFTDPIPAPRGAMVAILDAAGPPQLLDVVDGKLILARKLPINGEPSGACAWSLDGRLFAAGMWDGHVRVWEAATGAVLFDFASSRVGRSSRIVLLAFVPESGDLYGVTGAGETKVWPVATGAPDVLTAHASYVYPVSLSADGSLLLSAGWDGYAGRPGAVKLWDARTGALIAEYGQAGEFCEAAELTPDGRHAVLHMRSGPPRIDILDLLQGRARIAVADVKDNVVLHPDGRRLFHSGSAWDVATGERLATAPWSRYGGRFSPDGRLLIHQVASAPAVHSAAVPSGAEVGRWQDPEGKVALTHTFSPDGRWFLTGFADGKVCVRDVPTGNLVAEFGDAGSEILAVAVHPHGTRIATGGRDNIIRLWDAARFELVAQLTGHDRYVYSLAWNSDGERLYSGSGDTRVRIWDTRTLAEQVAAKRARAAAMPEIERRVGRALAEPDDPQRALEALLVADDLDARGRELVKQAAIAMLVPRADAERHRGKDGGKVASPPAHRPRGPAWVRASRATVAPTLDGRLDDPAWSAAPWTDPFVDIEGPVKPSLHHETRAKFTWDDSNLYVAATLAEPQLRSRSDRRDQSLDHENHFAVFVDPQSDDRWYGEVAVNALGAVYGRIRPAGDSGLGLADVGWPLPGLRCAVAIDGTLDDPSDTDRGWTLEMAIPHAALAGRRSASRSPKIGDVWRVNLVRGQWPMDSLDGRYVERPGARGDLWVWTPHFAKDLRRRTQWGFVELVER